MNNLTGRQIYGTRKPIVSVAARESARGENCTVNLRCCNYDTSTTVLAHLRFSDGPGWRRSPPTTGQYMHVPPAMMRLTAGTTAQESEWEFEDILRAWGELGPHV